MTISHRQCPKPKESVYGYVTWLLRTCEGVHLFCVNIHMEKKKIHEEDEKINKRNIIVFLRIKVGDMKTKQRSLILKKKGNIPYLPQLVE